MKENEMRCFSRCPCASFIVMFAAVLSIVFLVAPNCSKDKKQADITECMRFADQHWSEDLYDQWLHNFDGRDGQPIQSDTEAYWDKTKQDYVYFSHHLPNSKTQQYYEMIGEYEQFSWGWDDYTDVEITSPRRISYLECLLSKEGL
ncbi:MAG: hypothetical protein WCE90_12415 [Candidatus Zixiibacteriota bacterium]